MPGEIAAAGSVTVEAFGVTVEVTADPRHLAAVSALFPPGARPASMPSEGGRFALVPAGDRGFLDVLCDQRSFAGPVDVGLAFAILDAQIHMHIALHAPDHVFVHAGVVGVGERAILLPGNSFAGKTTLVDALVRAGAEYWSDEYAVLDADGAVHSYAAPSMHATKERRVERVAARAGDRPLRVSLIAVTHYRPRGAWAPRTCSAGAGAIKLLEHAIPARSRPDQALAAVRRAATDALVLEGERGEAEETAAALLCALETSAMDATQRR